MKHKVLALLCLLIITSASVLTMRAQIFPAIGFQPEKAVAATRNFYQNLFNFSSPAAALLANTIVTPSNPQGWTTGDTRPGGAVNFVFDSTAPAGNGALQLTTNATNEAKAQFVHLENTPLSAVTELSYFTKQISGTPPNAADPSYQIAVLLDGTTNSYTNFVYEPYYNGTVSPGVWQQWDVDQGQYWSSRTVNAGGACSVQAGAGGPPFYTLSQLQTNCPNAVVAGIGVNVGTYNQNYNVETDLVNFNGAIYDFEPDQTTFVVDDDGQASATDCDATDAAAMTIQEAVNAANPGDTIKVCPGTYPELVSINKTLTINGARSGVSGVDNSRTGLPDTESVVTGNSGSTSFYVTASNVTIDGFTVQGNTNGNQFGAGIFIAQTGTAGAQIINNIVQNNIIGIIPASNSTIRANLIRNNNNPGPAGGTGIYTDIYASGASLSNITIDGNTITGNNNVGILLDQTGGSGSNITISNNNINGNGSALLLAGITSSSVTGNTIANSTAGSQFFISGANGLTITCNNITNGVTRGIRIGDSGSSNITLNNNNIAGNPSSGLQLDAGSYTGELNAENNYWGSPSGPFISTNPGGTGDAIIDPANQVDYQPFLTAPASCAPTLPPTPRNCSAVVSPYDVVGEFSIGSNPNCEYEYGNTANSNPDSTFALYPLRTSNGFSTPGLEGWYRSEGETGIPGIYKNTTGAPVTYATVTQPSDLLNLHPGANGERSVLRFVAPSAGNYQINGRFVGIDFSGGTTTDVLVLKRSGATSTELLTGDINGYNDVEPIAIPFVTLAAGDIIEFSVGYGNNGNYFYDSTGLAAVISPSETTRPTLEITPNGTTTTSSPITFTFTFSEPVTGFEAGDITVTNGTLSNFSGSGTTYTADVTPTPTGTQSTPVTVSVAQDAATDAAQNGNEAASSTVTFEDTTRPSLTITPSGTVNGSTTTYTFTFSEPVTGFTIGDIAVTSGTKSNFTGSGTTYTVDVTPTSNGPITISVPQDAAFDASGNGNTAASTTTNVRCNNVAIASGTTTLTGNQITVPITVDNTTGQGIYSYDFTLTYDPAVLTYNSVDNAGTLSSNFEITPNNSTPGTLTVSGFGTSPLTGSGTLLNLKFTVVGDINTTSALNFTNFVFNEGIPCVNTTNGSVSVISGTISGRVTYANSAAMPGVPGTVLNASGSVPVSATTDANGNYTLSGFGPGPYTVTPSKTGQVNGITNADATLVAQYVAGLTTLTPTQQAAADVTGNGTITSLDASYIAQYAAGFSNPNNLTGTWRFIPPNRSYPNVQTNYTNQDYSAILLGEVTGNWNPAAAFAASAELGDKKQTSRSGDNKQFDSAQPGQVVTVTAPLPQFVTAGTNFTVNLQASDTTGEGIFGYEFNLLYDQNVIIPQAANPCDAAGTISVGRSVVCNPNTPGLLRVVVFSTTGTPISGSGTLLKLNFTAVGSPGGSSPLTLQNFMFNEGTPQDLTVDGRVQILGTTGPTSAGASVAGRVLTANGRVISRARVTITGTDGEVRSTNSNQFGRFSFGNLKVGETYVVSVSSKGYSFAPQTVSVIDNLKELALIADQ